MQITKCLYKEVRRLNTKIRNERMERLINRIPAKTVLFNSKQWKKLDDYNKEDQTEKIVIKFNE